MMRPTQTPADIAARWLDCAHCKWVGLGKYAVNPERGLVTCPRCGAPLERRDMRPAAQRGGYVTK